MNFFKWVANFAINDSINNFEKIKRKIFNILNILGVVLLLINTIMLIFDDASINKTYFVISNIFPLLISVTVLWLMRFSKVTLADILAFIFFPTTFFLMSLYLEDRGVIYFEIVFAIYVFFFFDKYYIIIPMSILIWAYFFFGTYYQLQEFKHSTHKNLQIYEIVSFISANILFYFSIYIFSERTNTYQRSLDMHRRELQIANDKLVKKEQELTNRNATLNKIFSIVSHDLRAPVEGLNLIIKASKNEKQLGEAIQEILPDFKIELHKMSTLFENLISWAKMEIDENHYLDFKNVDINLSVNKVINQMKFPALNKQILIEKNVERDLNWYGNSNTLEIVIRNFVSNAIKFTNEGGKVNVAAYKQSNFLLININDNGIGMSTEAIDNALNSGFYTTIGTNNELGTGLGLRICKDLIKKQNGTLHLKSKLGEGTSIEIKLPY